MQLTPEQVAQFAEDGYLLLRGALTRSSPSTKRTSVAVTGSALISRTLPEGLRAKRPSSPARAYRPSSILT